ncbi:DNA repair protein RecN [Flavobacterium sp.]|uniref:DNA repair protein RecN n=1 Tax=Flavobacterium sp. TaxID=239 RepID=UPI00260A687D|nr:DNA repair protein RecN [Flavobacterium sp.]
MITALSIENYALIEKLSVNFSSGFTVITGETGAGKSILLGALGLVLGNRADLSALKNSNEKCVIEAHFSIASYQLHDFFAAHDLDYDADTIIRREILPSGKSRAFINDTPVNLSELQALGAKLIDVHSQHETQALNDDDFQFQLVDAVAGNNDILRTYQQTLRNYRKSQNTLQERQAARAKAFQEQDYHSFLWEELVAAQLVAGSQEEMESQLEKLTHVELIQSQLAKVLSALQRESFGVVDQLKESKNALSKIASFSPEYQQILTRISSVLIEIDDIATELQEGAEQLQADPEILQSLQEQLQTIYTLQKKHQVQTIDALLKIQESLQSKMVSLTNLEEEIVQLEQEVSGYLHELEQLAQTLTQNRQAAVGPLVQELQKIVANLGMPNAQFAIEFPAKTTLTPQGDTGIQLLFAANKGVQLGTLKKVASGGELSRIMLAVKAILSTKIQLPSLILDEIDTGVSGEIAHKIGEIMRGMSRNIQLFAITHLPQIAGKGQHHFKVYKVDDDTRTKSNVKALNEEERIQEIAQMLSGEVVTPAAIGQARELLN